MMKITRRTCIARLAALASVLVLPLRAAREQLDDFPDEISADDPLYHHALVYRNGELLQNCTRANRREGWALVIQTDNLRLKRVHGVITFASQNL